MMRQRMKDRGMSDEEINGRLQQLREGGPPGSGRGPGGDTGAAGSGQIPPRLAERIKAANPEELEQIKVRMKQFGLSDERIAEVIQQIRGDGGARN